MDIINLIITSPEFKETLKDVVNRTIEERQSGVSEPILYTRDQLRRILHLSLPTIDRYTNLGILEAKKVGNRTLYSKESVDKALKEFAVRKYRRA
ncbi:MAG TPA: helix-turn-helix domain-containing protein [Bacteroidales bacterium]|nr:helix-turn-helix domain-containing protein [Bacteroidales bacterium]